MTATDKQLLQQQRRIPARRSRWDWSTGDFNAKRLDKRRRDISAIEPDRPRKNLRQHQGIYLSKGSERGAFAPGGGAGYVTVLTDVVEPLTWRAAT